MNVEDRDTALRVLREIRDDVARMQAEIDRLRAALQAIASTDYRGPEPIERRLAREALSE